MKNIHQFLQLRVSLGTEENLSHVHNRDESLSGKVRFFISTTPTFDSELGIEVDTATVVVVPEVPEHSFYLMQWLRIGGNNHLIFFDRGANTHLVQGKIAVASRFELTSSRPTSLTVVGGGNLKIEYGSYRFNLGPGAGGEYHEIS